ncbi:MAG: hypothetical protein ACKVS6_14740, partial [Planctomycetota bacterium]
KTVDPRECWFLLIHVGGKRKTLRILDAAPNATETVHVGDITLDAPRVISGTIQYADGSPAAGARVAATSLPKDVVDIGLEYIRSGQVFFLNENRLSFQNAPGNSIYWRPPQWIESLYDKLPFATAETRPDGSFRIDDASGESIYLLIDAPGAAPSHAGPFVSNNAGQIRLHKGTAISGAVVDTHDAPVPFAEVAAAVPSARFPSELAFVTKTLKADAKGNFTIPNVTTEKLHFAARAPSAAEWHVAGELKTNEGVVKIQIPIANSILVEARDAAGKPVDAELRVFRAATHNSQFADFDLFHQQAPLLNMAEGASIQISGYAGRVRFEASSTVADSNGGWAIPVRTEKAETLRSLGDIAWYDTKQSGESIIVDRYLDFNIESDNHREISPLLYTPIQAKIERVEAGLYRIHGLYAADYKIVGHAGALPDAETRVTTALETEAKAELIFSQSRNVNIQVFAMEGAASRPVANARVMAARSSSYETVKTSLRASSTTNASGEASLLYLTTEPYQFHVNHPGYAPTVASEEHLITSIDGIEKASVGPNAKTNITIILTKGARIEGRILSGGTAPAGQFTVLLESNPPDPFLNVRRAVTRPDGTFTFDHLAEGNYKILIGERWLGNNNAIDPIFGEWFESARKEPHELSLAADEVRKVDIDLMRPARPPIEGTVTIDGAPATGHQIRYISNATSSSETKAIDAQGNFHLGPADPGTYCLLLTQKESGATLARLEINTIKGERQWIRWNVQLGSMSGIVYKSDGKPAENGSAVLRAKAAAGSVFANELIEMRFKINENGAFTAPQLPAGDYYVYAVSGTEKTRPQIIQVREGKDSQVTVRLVATYEIEGILQFDSEVELQFCTLQIRPQDNDDPNARREIDIDPSDKKFETDGLRPGTYSVTIENQSTNGASFTKKLADLIIPIGGLKDHVIRVP